MEQYTYLRLLLELRIETIRLHVESVYKLGKELGEPSLYRTILLKEKLVQQFGFIGLWTVLGFVVLFKLENVLMLVVKGVDWLLFENIGAKLYGRPCVIGTGSEEERLVLTRDTSEMFYDMDRVVVVFLFLAFIFLVLGLLSKHFGRVGQELKIAWPLQWFLLVSSSVIIMLVSSVYYSEVEVCRIGSVGVRMNMEVLNRIWKELLATDWFYWGEYLVLQLVYLGCWIMEYIGVFISILEIMVKEL